MARHVLQWNINKDCTDKTFHGSIYPDSTVTYPVLCQCVFSCMQNKFNASILIRFVNLTGMSLMEAKSDILKECKMKFLYTFQVRFLENC
jgi:hypothetical protein